MLPRSFRSCCLCAFGAALASCATVVDPAADFEAAHSSIRATTGLDAAFDPAAPVLTEAELAQVLAGGLTLDEALTLALTNNRRLQAGFLELGVGRAEFVQAGLLRNPSLGLAFLLPSGGGRTRIGADLVESIAELWQLRRREQTAQLGQDQRILDVSRFAGELVVGTKSAYVETVGAREAREVAEQSVALARSVLSGVQRKAEVGVVTKTEAGLAQSAVLAAELVLRRQAQAEEISKQRLAGLLSLDMDLQAVVLTDAMPGITSLDWQGDEIVANSREFRLDLRSAALGVELAEAQVRLEQSKSIPAASLGITAERPESGSSTSFLGGVVGSVELPLFDQNQAQVSRAAYRRDALKKELEALSAEVAADVRAALAKFRAAGDAARFVERELLQQAHHNWLLAQRSFELGDMTLLTLLESERRLLDARQVWVEVRLEAARAQVELERSIGAPLEVLRPSASVQPLDSRPR